MSFFAAADKIELRASNGAVVFSTDNKMPALVDTISGSIFLNNTTQGYLTFDLGEITADCDFIFPTYAIDIPPEHQSRIASGGVPGLPTSGLGCHLAYVDGRDPHDGRWNSYLYIIVWACVLNTRVVNNRVLLSADKFFYDHLYRNDPDVAVTVKYRIHAGKFI